ncbi:hypothetical protein [Flavobacterium hercynium]|uniref:Uncharacterized protein n=1 Tax=Flavobacterium hercynium TaxID=387094 RepID=A0A226HFH4_9FLAO|nr:hypothetical protein [Flavobacterium hercynium]OXA93099.1 hypothetical protein B0A66_07430 [Flavobacterium hercynium]SMP32473.1 hypothetical protein SAMN06265346_11530 [Flavobacterium hercynium]
MKSLKIFVLFLGCLLTVNCKDNTDQTKITSLETEVPKVEEQTKETAKQIAKEVAERFKPKDAEIVHEVIQTKVWGKKDVIIVFYASRYIDDQSTTIPFERQYVEGYFLIPDGAKNYKKVLIYKFEDDNVETIIQSVFFANADKDSERELIILTTCSHRLELLYDGTEYYNYVFDNFDMNKIPKEMTYLSDISASIYGGFEGQREDGPSKADFKTAADVKAELKKLGY